MASIGNPSGNKSKSDKFESPDFYSIDDLLSDEHKLIRGTMRDFVKREISPIIEDYAQRAEFPDFIMKKFGEIGALGASIPIEYGGGGLDYISYGLIMQEIERGDSGMRSAVSVQSSLVMYPIYLFGNEEQKMRFLPKLASGEMIGCFGLTEPDFGSNPGGLKTTLRKSGENYILNGSKMWITNSPVSDVAVVWAKDENERIKGVIVEKGMEGFSAPEIHNKWSLRSEHNRRIGI